MSWPLGAGSPSPSCRASAAFPLLRANPLARSHSRPLAVDVPPRRLRRDPAGLRLVRELFPSHARHSALCDIPVGPLQMQDYRATEADRLLSLGLRSRHTLPRYGLELSR